MFNIGLATPCRSLSILPHSNSDRAAHSHGTICSCEGSATEYMAIMVEVEPVYCHAHLIRYREVLLLVSLWHRYPLLQFWLPYNTITVQLVATTHQSVEWLLSMFRQKVGPHWVVSAVKAGSTEVVGVNTCTETIALRTSAIIDGPLAAYLLSMLPSAYCPHYPVHRSSRASHD